MRAKKILISGATGFIGRNLVLRFSRDPGVKVRAVYHKKKPYPLKSVEWVKADLTSPQDVKRVMRGVDVVLQAAAVTSGVRDIVQRPAIHTTDNAIMNSLLLRQSFESKISHFVYFSCTVMYPSSPVALAENAWPSGGEVHPRYFGAAWTKIYGEKMCEFYSRLGATKYTVIRHSNIYGPFDKFDLLRSHVFGATVTKTLSAKNRVVIWGTGEESRDLLYVDDLVDFVDASLSKQKSNFEIYNCGLGKKTTVNELTQMIIKASGRSLKMEHDLKGPHIKSSLFLDCRKAQKELGWFPKTGLRKGIEKTLSWWKNNRPHVKI